MVKVPKGYRSKNVEDRRGSGGSRGGGGFSFPGSGSGGGLGGNMGGGGGGGGLGGGATRLPSSRKGCGGGGLLVIVIGIVILFVMCSGGGGGGFGGDLGDDLGGSSTGAAPTVNAPQEEDAFTQANFILDEVQIYWTDYFAQSDLTYPPATLVIFESNVSTGGCGNASAGVGPFYCPADQKAYIDLQAMAGLQRQLSAEGDFAQAYILAHEIGHHVQNVVGTADQVRQAQSGASRAEANDLSVRMELQADCLAGMWAKQAEAQGLLDAGDLDEGVGAAAAVGDDAITGSSNQENFTHGSSAQRVEWFRRGFDTGDYDSCNIFEGV